MGRITVQVAREDRLKAIGTLSEAVLHLAKALDNTINVHVTGCVITGADVGISVQPMDPNDGMETIIRDFPDDLKPEPPKSAKPKRPGKR